MVVCLLLRPPLAHLQAKDDKVTAEPKGTISGALRLAAQVQRDTSPLVEGGTLRLSYAATVEKVRRSVVTVLVSAPPEDIAHGTGADAEEQEDDAFDISPSLDLEDTDDTGQEDEKAAPRSSGSGLILTAGGLIVTNAHVVRGPRR